MKARERISTDRGATERETASGKRDRLLIPLAAGAEYRAKNTGGGCALCGAPLDRRPGPGRPPEYCPTGCAAAADAVNRLKRAIEEMRDPTTLRPYLMAEVVNKLPVDREALSKRARRQARGPGGRFR